MYKPKSEKIGAPYFEYVLIEKDSDRRVYVQVKNNSDFHKETLNILRQGFEGLTNILVSLRQNNDLIHDELRREISVFKRAYKLKHCFFF